MVNGSSRGMESASDTESEADDNDVDLEQENEDSKSKNYILSRVNRKERSKDSYLHIGRTPTFGKVPKSDDVLVVYLLNKSCKRLTV